MKAMLISEDLLKRCICWSFTAISASDTIGRVHKSARPSLDNILRLTMKAHSSSMLILKRPVTGIYPDEIHFSNKQPVAPGPDRFMDAFDIQCLNLHGANHTSQRFCATVRSTFISKAVRPFGVDVHECPNMQICRKTTASTLRTFIYADEVSPLFRVCHQKSSILERPVFGTGTVPWDH